MRFIKIIGGILMALIVLYVIACFFGPKNANITRSIDIEASPAQIYSQFANLKNWEKWSPWSNNDETMSISYQDKVEGVGAGYSWNSEKQGGGSLEILEAVPGKSMKTKLKFDGWDGESYGSWQIEPTGSGGSKLSWGMNSETDIPFIFRGMSMGMPGALQNSFDEGLASIKKLAEESPKGISVNGFNILQIDAPEQHYMTVRNKIGFDKLAQHFETNFPKIMMDLEKKKAEIAGMPCGLFYEWDEVNMTADMASAIPIKSAVEATKGMEITTLPAGPALRINYYGSYEKSADAHYAIDGYLKEKNLKAKSPCLEQYITDPGSEPDTSKWLTQITYFLEN